MGDTSTAAEFSPAWIEARWRMIPAVGSEMGGRIDERACDAIVARGETPALIKVRLPGVRVLRVPPGEWRARSVVGDDLNWELTRPGLQRLRPLLPADCFPVNVMCLHGDFVTGQASDLGERQELGTRLLAELERLPRAELAGAELKQLEPRVFVRLIDGGSDYLRARYIPRRAMTIPADGYATLVDKGVVFLEEADRALAAALITAAEADGLRAAESHFDLAWRGDDDYWSVWAVELLRPDGSRYRVLSRLGLGDDARTRLDKLRGLRRGIRRDWGETLARAQARERWPSEWQTVT